MDIIERYANEIKTAIYSAFIFLNIDTDIVKVLMILMFLDTVFGIGKSHVMGRYFSFKRLFEGIISKSGILLLPLVVALVGKGLGYDFKFLPELIIKLLVTAEGLSILTSFYTIRTKKEPKDVDFISLIIISIRKGLMKVFGTFITKLENPLPIEIDNNDTENQL